MVGEFKEIREASDLFNISRQAILKWIEDEKIKDKYLKREPSPGRKGYRYLINPFGAPEPHRSTYIKEHYEEDSNLLQQEMDAQAYAAAPKYAKEHASLWLNLIKEFGHLKGKDLKAAIRAWKEAHPEEKVSVKSFYRYRKAYKEEGLTALIPDWGNRKGESKVPDKYQELFETMYLKESQPSVESCVNFVRGKAYKDGFPIEEFPSARTFKYRLEQEHSPSFIYRMRNGDDAWRRKYGNYVDRDKSNVPANSCWVGDHRLLDIQVVNEETGNVFRPWCTAWMDFKTNKFINVFLHEDDPNSDHIFQSLKWGVEEFGRPFDSLYIDNGKDYRSKDFAGGRGPKANNARTLVNLMDLDVHFSLPYNAQSKTIERAFRGFIEYLEVHLPGYTGSIPSQRPESTKRMAKVGGHMPFKKFKELFEDFIYNVLNNRTSEGKELQGRSPNEAFFSEFNRKIAVKPKTLQFMCMRTSRDLKIGPNGVKDSELGKFYYDWWMERYKGRKVYLRRDIKAWQKAIVIDAETDVPLGEATIKGKSAAIAKTDIERKTLKDDIKENKKIDKHHKKKRDLIRKRQSRPEELLEYLKADIEAQNHLRKANGTYQEYDENVEIVEMDSTKADEMLQQLEKKTKKQDPTRIVPFKDKKKKSRKSKHLLDVGLYQNKTGTDKSNK